MAKPDLHSFQRDLANKPGKGSDAPPRTLRAKDLDENFKKVTLLESDEDSPVYSVEYSADGVRIKFAPPGEGTFVLGAVNGQVQWIATEDCS
jgi:hypothetical protein